MARNGSPVRARQRASRLQGFLDEWSIARAAHRADTPSNEGADFDRGRRAWIGNARIAKTWRRGISRDLWPIGPWLFERVARWCCYEQSGADRACLAALPRLWCSRGAGGDSVAS